jgi:predicted RNA binding protein YcfA (HicA-like mRNA interferase family)
MAILLEIDSIICYHVYMTKQEKLINKILEEKSITFEEAQKVLLSLGYTERTPKGGSSHVTFTKSPNQIITLVKTQKPLKKYLIKLIKEAILND